MTTLADYVVYNWNTCSMYFPPMKDQSLSDNDEVHCQSGRIEIEVERRAACSYPRCEVIHLDRAA